MTWHSHVRAQVTDNFAGDNERSWLTSLAKSGGDALANAGAQWVDLIRFLLGVALNPTSR